MDDVNWAPALWATAGGLLLGVVAALWARRGPVLPDAAPDADRKRARLLDLRARKALLVEQLRDLHDMAEVRLGSAVPEEAARLEQQAAAVLREIEAAEAEAPPAETRVDAMTVRRAERRGAIQGALAASAVALVAFLLGRSTGPRPEGGSMTGGPVSTGQTATGQTATGQTAPMGERAVPKALQPKPSPRVDAARASLAAEPGSLPKKAELGWALLEAEGWIDAYRNASEILEADPGHPDGLVQTAIVRLRMGQVDLAASMIEKALARDPKHPGALGYRGIVKFQRGDRDGAKADWQAAAAVAPGEGYEELVQMAENGGSLPGMGGGHPGTTGGAGGGVGAGAAVSAGGGGAAGGGGVAGSTTASGAGGSARVSGQVEIAEGAAAPSGGVLFLVARRPGQERGPPAATKKIPSPTFPLAFDLGPENVMMGGGMPEEMMLSARWDEDGDPLSRGPSDREGRVEGLVAPGESGLRIVIR
jgi:tetratricopeptide (TPR) repeat protein